MRVQVAVILWLCALLAGCGGSSQSPIVGGNPIAAPVIASTAAQNGAVIVSITPGVQYAQIRYTTDGSKPESASQFYQGPFLVASNLTVKAIDILDLSTSDVANQAFSPNIPSGTLVWSDDFTNNTGANTQPDPSVWAYDTGTNCCGNNELENYCAWNSSTAPCDPANPNTYVGTDGYLHILGRNPSANVYTSARLKSQGLFSFQYGRLEFSALVPEAQGLWPAVWLLGNNISTINWPACGEQDVLERINAAGSPNDWNAGSIHGTGFTGGTGLGTIYNFPNGQTAAQWHTYGMIWSPGNVQYYIDDPSNIYASFTPTSLNGLGGAVWPFDKGQSNFLIFNLAIGGDWPGPPDGTTPFPAEMLVDYVRIYTN